MKKHIKLFEEFNTDDFLEDLGIDYLTPKKIKDAVSLYYWENLELKNIFSGKINIREPYKNNIEYIIEYHSQYSLSKILPNYFGDASKSTLQKVVEAEKIFPIIPIHWMIHINEISITTSNKQVSVGVYARALLKGKKFIFERKNHYYDVITKESYDSCLFTAFKYTEISHNLFKFYIKEPNMNGDLAEELGNFIQRHRIKRK